MTIYGGGTGTPINVVPVVSSDQPYPGVIHTHVSLGHYAKIMGINPAHFNGADQVNLADGRILYKLENAQMNIWPEYSHQSYDQVSREQLAREIFSAESEIESILGAHLSPYFEDSDIYSMQEFYRPEYGGSVVVTYDGEYLTNLRRGKFISVGARKLTSLGTYAVAYTDEDLDGFNEIASVSFDVTSVLTGFDIFNVKLYYPNTAGEPEYEIRPSRARLQSGTVVTIKFDTPSMVHPLVQRRVSDDAYGWIADLTDTTNLLDAVDVYYESVDTTQWSCKFSRVDHETLDASDVYGLAILRNTNPVLLGAVPATYDGATWQKTSCDAIQSYDYVSFRYLSGYSERTRLNISMGQNVPENLARAVCYLATARLPRIYYANNNATALAEHLREDMALNDQGESRFLQRDDGYNPFGTKYGEIMAWRLITKLTKAHTAGVAI